MKFRRRKYINDTKLQLKFVSTFVIVCLLCGILTSAVFNYLALKKLESLMWSTHINIESTDELLTHLFMNVNIINFISVAALLIIAGFWRIRKITGPLYRMREDIGKVAEGDLPANIALRQKDELKDIAYELNNMIKSIRDRFAAINKKYEDISESIGGLKRKPVEKETSIKAHELILEKIGELESEMKGFKL
ncbi:MAG: methyl-accepting chemotaxis protein [Nitrospirota bacterium]